jgi:Fe2+ transport system protein B
MICCLPIHILMSAKVVGTPLLLSMLLWKFRHEDSPRNWFSRLRGWFSNFPNHLQAGINQFVQGSLILKIVEVVVFGGVITAFVLPLFLSGGE